MPETAFAANPDGAKPEAFATLLLKLTAAELSADKALIASSSQLLITTYPDKGEGYRVAFRALLLVGAVEEATLVVDSATNNFPGQTWPLILNAELAFAARDFPHALNVGGVAVEMFPANSFGYATQAKSLREMGRHSEAREITDRALVRFPKEMWPLLETGWLEIASGDPASALATAQKLEERFGEKRSSFLFRQVAKYGCDPTSPVVEEAFSYVLSDWASAEPFQELASLLRQLHRYDEAAIVISDAIMRFPAQHWPRTEKNLLAIACAHYTLDDGAFHQIATQLALNFPYIDDAYAIEAERLLGSHEWTKADQLLRALEPRLYQHLRLGTAWADVSILQEEFNTAEERLQRLRTSFPNALEAYTRLGKVLSRLGRKKEAEEVMRQAEEWFPDRWEAFDAGARMALLLGEPAEAAAKWVAALQRFPNNPRLREGLHDAELAVFENQETDGPSSLENSEGSEDELDPQALMLRFQNIGSPTHGCEFGNVQRFFGAEPLGLLRWVAARPSSLALAIQDRFAGFWDEQNTNISLGPVPQRPDEREYRLYFPRYDMHIHTFIYLSEVAQDEFVRRYRLRQKLLSRKFFEDLESGDTIFVYKTDLLEIPEAEIKLLLDTMQKHGEHVTLLFVKKANSDNRSGSVKSMGNGLFHGYIDDFIIRPDGNEGPIYYNAWLEVCRATLILASRVSASTTLETAVTCV